MSPIAPLFKMTGIASIDMMNLMTGFNVSSPSAADYYIYGAAKIVYECLVAHGQKMSDEPSQLSFHLKRIEMLLADTNRASYTIEDFTTVQNLRLCLLATVNQKIDEMSKLHYLQYASPTSPAFKLPPPPAPRYPRPQVKNDPLVVSLEVFDFILQATRAVLFTPSISKVYGELSDEIINGCYTTFSSLATSYNSLHIRTSSDASRTLTSSFDALRSTKLRERHNFKIGANRDIAYARLSGFTVGEYRDAGCGIHKKEDYIAHGFCVCSDSCKCTRECNKQPVRACPCQLPSDNDAAKKLRRLDRKINAIGWEEINLPLTRFRAKASDGAKASIKYIVMAARGSDRGCRRKEMMMVFKGLLKGFRFGLDSTS